MEAPPLSIQQAIDRFIEIKKRSRSLKTGKTYGYALLRYAQVLEAHGLKPDSPITEVPEQSMAWLLDDLKDLAIATEKLYTAAVTEFYSYLEADSLRPVNNAKIRQLVRQHGRRQPRPIYNYETDEVEKLIECSLKFIGTPAEGEKDRLINLRDRALIVTLADTGLRIHEACKLTRGDINMNTGQTVVTGKGNKDAVVRFSVRSLNAIRDYLAERTPLIDGKSGRPLASLPLFIRHDKGAGGKAKAITTKTGRDIIEKRVIECLGVEHVGLITPHTLRHRFVTNILRSSGNIKLAQKLARHENISITERYAHLTDEELDNGYRKAFEKE